MENGTKSLASPHDPWGDCPTCGLSPNLCNCSTFDHDARIGKESMAARKKKPPTTQRKKATGDALLFRRTTKPTKSIVNISDLWLDLFVMYSEAVVNEHPDHNPAFIMRTARNLADAALDTYQDRWPGVEPPQQ